MNDQLERDLEAARRVPATLKPETWVGCTYDPDQDNDEFSIEDSAQTVWTNWYDSTEPTSPESAERLRLLLDAACAAPRLAEVVTQQQAEITRLRECLAELETLAAWSIELADELAFASENPNYALARAILIREEAE